MSDLLGLLFLPLGLGAALVPLLPRRVAPWISLGALATALAIAAGPIAAAGTATPAEAFGGLLRLDGRGAILLSLILGLAFVAALVSAHTETRQRRLYALLLLFTATMALSASADNLGILWAGVEATTLSSALLVGHRRTREATEAAWKYLILSSTGISLAFVATALLAFGSAQAGDATLSFSSLVRTADRLDPGLASLVLVLATVGYGTKAGLVPLHFWLPDAHSEAPSPVSALLSGALLSCAMLALDRVATLTAAAGAPTRPLLLTFGAASVLAGGALVLVARNYKRLLAYSSVENMGLVTLGLAIGTPVAVAGAYLHVLTHGAAKALAFFGAGRIHHHLGTKVVDDTRAVLARAPAAGTGLFVGALALAGLPLLGPFTSKVMILAGALQTRAYLAATVAMLGLALAFVGFARLLAAILPGPRPAGERPARERATFLVALLILVAANLILALAGPSLLTGLLGHSTITPGASP